MTLNSYEWFIQKNLDDYSGKWVVILENKVLDSDEKLENLMKRVKSKRQSSKLFITRIRNKLLRLHS